MSLNSEKIVSVLATHNERLQCFLDLFFTTNEKIRFKNCAIVRFSINKTKITIDLVYSGELDPSENKKDRTYYISGNNINGSSSQIKEVVFEKKEFPLEQLIGTLNINNFDLYNKEYVFYIIRHGQGIHNLKGATHLVIDTDVTNNGQQQAKNAGAALMKVMTDNNENKINYLFASDLSRTRQTIQYLYLGISFRNEDTNIKSILNFFPNEIIILPCSHELNYSKNGNCDKNSSLIKIGSRENDPKCSNRSFLPQNSISNEKSSCNNISDSGKNFLLNWSFYLGKNKNNVRNFDCSTTNMINLAIEFINTKLNPDFQKNIQENLNKFMNLPERDSFDPNVSRIGAGLKKKTKKTKKTRKTRKTRKTKKTKKTKKNNEK